MIRSLHLHSFLVLFSCLAFCCAPPLVSAATSADRLWQSVDQIPQARAGALQDIKATSFKAFTLDAARLQSVLSAAPLEFSEQARASEPVEITLPKPDGGFARFRVEEVALMEPGLAAKFPQIKTYRGRDIDDPLTSLQLDVNPNTVHAQVLSPSGAYYIDPYWHRDGSVYMSYSKSDTLTGDRDFKCLADDEQKEGASALRSAPAAVDNQNTGKFLRTYRLACGTSLRYSQYHGGAAPNVAQVLAALVTMTNRVSGIYETELGIRMVLVANQEQVIASATNSTPYTDTPGDIFTNPAYLDEKIGADNYDIGHVVTVGSGGIAGLGVVCRGFDFLSGGSAKARGTTGIDPPTGDPFWVDFVAHEMGHQFGGNHTFNGDGSNCGTNSNRSTAYEPGSGSTIQAYAGICGAANNLQPNSDPYFHFVSLQEMFGFATSGIGGRPFLNVEKLPVRGSASPDASPGSGTLQPTGSDVTWTGTAFGGSALDEETCVEGITCDTFMLTLGGSVSDWAGKSARITFTWPNPVDDYDIYVRKNSITGPLVGQSASSGQPEIINIDPAAREVGTGLFAVRIVYFAVVPPAQQYQAVATVRGGGGDPGPAPTCAAVTATGNNPPTVNAGIDYTIPARTPFALTATGNDPDGDLLTYCWEEADLGPTKPASAPDDGQGPIFRSFLPTTNPTRIFPRLQSLLANQTQTIGEKLPTTTRELNFRVTARDNRFGGWGMDSMKINVLDSGSGFAVTSPNTGMTFSGGATHTVTWATANTTVPPISTSLVNIRLSTDGGNTFPIVLVANTPNDGSETLTIPMVSTSTARVMVQAVDNIYFDISDQNFTITALLPQLVSAGSRKVHGTTPYDINLPLAGPPYGIECRMGGGDGNQHTLVFTFNNPIVSVGNAAVSDGAVASSGVNPANPNEYIVELTGVQSGQYLTATLNGVNGDGDAAVTFGVLLGDTNGNGIVNATDVGQTKAQSGNAVSPANFRLDVTVSDSINSSDVGLVKSRSGTSIQ
ncbi:MAG: hypothetical protein H0V56_06220 [Chthoniobacterales bacterium]|nr:hypothetical protein [Chthoniobacterales bacterium]